MAPYELFKLAAIQAEPVYFDKEASANKACRLIREAGKTGANLAAFGETWLPGYPFFVYGKLDRDMGVEYLANSIEIPGRISDRLCEAAQSANIDVVIGVAERDTITQGTTYCTLLFIGSNGGILGRHRKLKPTHRERVVWGEGDGSTLAVYERPYAKISGLNCWEHKMVLPGYALMAQGTQVHVAAWPGMGGEESLFLSQAFASQAAAYVINIGATLAYDRLAAKYQDSIDSVPESVRESLGNYPGNSCIIDPRGKIIAGPAEGETILTVECSAEQIYAAKGICDVGGHYSRPDVFQLRVNRTPHRRISEIQEQNGVDSIEKLADQ